MKNKLINHICKIMSKRHSILPRIAIYIYIYIYIYIVIKRGDSTQAHLYKYRTMYIVQVYITVISYTKNSLFFLIMTSLS